MPTAQNNLGFMYRYGYGVTKDYVAAYVWYTLAATGGSTKASTNRNSVAKLMTSSQIAEAERRARNWKPGRRTIQASTSQSARHNASSLFRHRPRQHNAKNLPTPPAVLPPILSFEDITLSKRCVERRRKPQPSLSASKM